MSKEILGQTPEEHLKTARKENPQEVLLIRISRAMMATVTPVAIGGTIYLASKGDEPHALLVASGGVMLDMTALAVHWAANKVIKSESRANKRRKDPNR